MGFIFELVFQVVFEVFAELFLETGSHGAARVLRSRLVRFTIASAVGLGVGLWWGTRLSEMGRVQQPRMLWISLALAIAAGLGAVWRWRRSGGVDDQSVLAPPWRWPAKRLAGFAVFNAAIAAGVVIGFDPQTLR